MTYVVPAQAKRKVPNGESVLVLFQIEQIFPLAFFRMPRQIIREKTGNRELK